MSTARDLFTNLARKVLLKDKFCFVCRTYAPKDGVCKCPDLATIDSQFAKSGHTTQQIGEPDLEKQMPVSSQLVGELVIELRKKSDWLDFVESDLLRKNGLLREVTAERDWYKIQFENLCKAEQK